ncbi:MAG: hypothetical protein KatS3mg099_213 [Candidatus Parcubacteria bacterium]|nr:MAG: hypothetical protein KatS3mg099_213 [Candidatus Parcubacteria bacterium]
MTHTQALHSIEQRVLQALARKPASCAQLARAFKVPYTTVRYHLHRLARCGVVRLADQPRQQFGALWEAAHRKGRPSPIEVFTGRAFVEAASRFVRYAPRGCVVYVVQESGTIPYTRKYLRLFRNHIIKTQRSLRRRRIVVKTIMNPELLALFRAAVRDVSVVEAHKGKTVGIKFLGGDLLRGAGEIDVLPTMFLFLDYLHERAVVVRDEVFANLLYQICGVLFDALPSAPAGDFNLYLTNVERWLCAREHNKK